MLPEDLQRRDRDDRRLAVIRRYGTVLIVKITIAVALDALIYCWWSPVLIDTHVGPLVVAGFALDAVALIVTLWTVVSLATTIVKFTTAYESQ